MPLPPFDLMSGPPSAKASSSKTSNSKGSGVSQASLFDLKGLVSEHKSTFSKEGKNPVKGEALLRRGNIGELSRDKFSRQSPNLHKRMEQQAAREAKRARIYDDEERVTEGERQEIMRRKAERYAKMRKGEVEEGKESTIDFHRKMEDDEDHWSNHSSDVDESAIVPDDLRHARPEDDAEIVEYIDEMGRTRQGTRADAREAEEAKREGGGPARSGDGEEVAAARSNVGIGDAHAEVMQSNVIYGDQSFFPVYEPTQEELKERYRAVEGEPDVIHYDSRKEVRAKGAGFYQFAQEEDARKEQMENLMKERTSTEAARHQVDTSDAAAPATSLSLAMDSKKRKLDERKAMLEAKRQKLLGGKEALERKRQEITDRAADALLEEVKRELES